jgi:hypothetical protein
LNTSKGLEKKERRRTPSTLEPQNLAHKKPKKTAGKPTIMDETSPLATQLKDAEQNLKTEKEKIRIFEKKINTLKKGRIILITRFKARKETIDNRNKNIIAV